MSKICLSVCLSRMGLTSFPTKGFWSSSTLSSPKRSWDLQNGRENKQVTLRWISQTKTSKTYLELNILLILSSVFGFVHFSLLNWFLSVVLFLIKSSELVKKRSYHAQLHSKRISKRKARIQFLLFSFSFCLTFAGKLFNCPFRKFS